MHSIRKLLFSAFVFVSLTFTMKAQTSWLETLGIDFDFDVPKPVVTYKDLIGVGSARHMSGNICVLYLFVGTETSQWSQDEIEATAQKLYAAEDWLKAEALRYGKKVEFHNYSIKRQLTDNNIPSDPFKPDAVNYPKTVLRRFGYSSNRELHDILSRKTNCQQFLVLIFSRIAGRCYASAVNRNMARKESGRTLPECCMLYQISNDTGRELQVGRIAHEMLHLFGAWDFYAVNADDKERSERAAELFPTSIMLRSYGDITQSTIDPLTAWLTGLSRKEQDWYKELMPPQ